MDAQELIEISAKDDLEELRNILECKNHILFFGKHKSTMTKDQFQRLGITMLFLSVNRNSELIFYSLKYLNSLHKLYSTERFRYDEQVVKGLTFSNHEHRYFDDFLITLYACVESPFNGARPEALVFFKYWTHDLAVAQAVFNRIAMTWPWTNRNKYYFLSILFEQHSFYELIRNSQRNCSPKDFLQGIRISLQYRNLISPGQTLAVTLAKQDNLEVAEIIADILESGTEFELKNCTTHWMRCLSNCDRIFKLLHLDGDFGSSIQSKRYLFTNNMQRLLLFRVCFEESWNRQLLETQIDDLIKTIDMDQLKLVDRIPIFDIIVRNLMNEKSAKINEDILLLVKYLNKNRDLDCPALRNHILKFMPSIIYYLSVLFNTNQHNYCILKFFENCKLLVTDGFAQCEYQLLIFGLRLYEILMKLSFGCKQDRLIKEFNIHKSNRLKEILTNDCKWDICSAEHCDQLQQLLDSDYDDVRDISCAMLIRFFPPNVEIVKSCYLRLQNTNISICNNSYYLARIGICAGETDFYATLQVFLRQISQNLKRINDPFDMYNSGHNFFGALNSLNEFYTTGHSLKPCIDDDIQLVRDVTEVLLRLFGIEFDGGELPSFDQIDYWLTYYVAERTEKPSTDVHGDKKGLLMSIWMSIKACCNLATNIGVFILNRMTFDPTRDNGQLKQCLDISVQVLLKFRHKGAMEAAGSTFGRLVRAISGKTNESNQDLYLHWFPQIVRIVFEHVRVAGTTRRGAGITILMQHFVKNTIKRDGVFLQFVMDFLFRLANDLSETTENSSNNHNVMATILHCLCVLVKDGELKTAITAYMCELFSLAILSIESKEWTIRNAALQLFGAIVPKLVGQTQFFDNEQIDWEPVYTIYNDIFIKMNRIHRQILQLMEQCSRQPSILLVTILEFLAHVETIGDFPFKLRFQEIFYEFLKLDNCKIRNLSAKCLARFYEFFEIPAFITASVPLIFQNEIDENFRHGLVVSVIFMLQKYKSDSRFMLELDDLFIRCRGLVTDHFQLIENSFYLRCYLLDLYLLLEFDKNDDIVVCTMFGSTISGAESIETFLNNICSRRSKLQFGLYKWKSKCGTVYLNQKSDIEIDFSEMKVDRNNMAINEDYC